MRAQNSIIVFNLVHELLWQTIDIVKVDALAQWKISKRHFLKDIENSFHQVTHIGLEPHHFFFFLTYLNKYTR